MPRRPRPESETGHYHWINRGVNQKHIFHFKDDYLHFLQLLAHHKPSYGVEINHYCLMPNHIHLLLKCPQKDLLSRFSQIIQRRYAYYYCKTHKWKGQVFQRMYKGLPIDSEAYLLECARYIERNPVRARLTSAPTEYPYSGCRAYVNGSADHLLSPTPAYLELADDEYIRQECYGDYVSQTRMYEGLIDKALLAS